tara:strand:- start:272 stop:679 length:408 start_codon:yes stop_codon:yes gene_type:complete
MSTEKIVFAILKKISKQDKVELSGVADLETSYVLYSEALVERTQAIERIKEQYQEITAMLSDLNYELGLYEDIKAEMEDLRMSTSDLLDEVTIKAEELGVSVYDIIPNSDDIQGDLGADIDDDILRDALEIATGY